MMDDRIRGANGGVTRPPIFVSVQTSAFSGATLLSLLLGSHPAVATVGEMNGLIEREDPETYLCSCGARIKVCPFWQDVGAAMRCQGFAFDPGRFDLAFTLSGPKPARELRMRVMQAAVPEPLRKALLTAWPGEARRIRERVARNEAFVKAVLAVTGKQVFVDTSKDRLRLQALARFSTFDLRALHLVRDVRGVVASRLQRGQVADARQAARQWARLHDRLQRTISTLPDERRLRVRYEDLCSDLNGSLVQLYRFCGVDPAAVRIDPRSSHIVGNPMRLSDVGEVRLDERWRKTLSAEQLRVIQWAAGAINSRYGYQ